MGAQLVGKVFVFAAANDMKPTEFRLLAFMAHTALDSDNPPRYFGSREMSAFGIGRMVEDDSPNLTDQQRSDRSAAFQAVKVATQGLVRMGAIERLQRGRLGHRATFALTFRGTESLPLQSTESLPRFGTESLPPGVGQTYPQGTTEEPPEEQASTNTSAYPSTSPAPVDNPN